MSHQDPESSVLMQVPEISPFVRALLPVRLTGGFTLTFGVWIAISPDDFQRSFRVWWEPDYQDLVLQGFLANALPQWGLLGVPVLARVKDTEHTPYLVESSDESLMAVLHDEWPHEVLDLLP
ncbi:MAG: hypothetical protein QOE35_2995 [Actinomycetota bacterium]|jgi:hypothetical protein